MLKDGPQTLPCWPITPAVCIARHLVDTDEESNESVAPIERWVEVDEKVDVISREEHHDGVQYMVGVPSNGATGWYDEADFLAKFKFI